MQLLPPIGIGRTAHCIAVGCFALMLSTIGVYAQDSTEESKPNYKSRFGEGNSDGWSHKSFVTVDGRKLAWLGEFNKENVTLSIKDLPDHKFIKLEFELATLKSWGGHSGGHHADRPDLLKLTVVDGPQLMHASFGNGPEHRQSFPDDLEHADHPPKHGATRVDDAEFLKLENGDDGGNSVYGLTFVFPHDTGELKLSLQASLPEALPENASIRNESWAIGNVRVTAIAEPKELSDDEFKELWAQLAKPDGMDGFNAIWQLIGGGDAALTQIEKQWKDKTTSTEEKTLRKKFDDVLARLGSEKFTTRAKAQEELMAMDSKMLPWIREALAKHKDDAELSSRLGRAIKFLEKRSAGQMIDYRPMRLHRLLNVVATDRAKKLLATIPPPAKVKPKTPPVERPPVPFPMPRIIPLDIPFRGKIVQ